MAKVFLSHSHANKPFARKLATDLRTKGHSVWIDEAEINIGDSLIAKIREGLDEVDFVAAILSSASIQSEWVTKELEIASNREIEEKRVVVLPLLVELVPLPGFLKGKFYADFTDNKNYEEQFERLLRALGPVDSMTPILPDEYQKLKEELVQAKIIIENHRKEIENNSKIALKGKSKELIIAIGEANKAYPQHAPINNTYAFEVGDKGSSMPITLDYLMHAIAKSNRKGAHILEVLLSLENKWDRAESMINAYIDMVESI